MLSKQKQTHMAGNEWKRKKLFQENNSIDKNKFLSLWACFSPNDSVRPVFFFFFSFYPLTDWIDILPGTQYLFPFWKIETPSCISCLNYDPTEYPNAQAREVRIILDPSSFSTIIQFLSCWSVSVVISQILLLLVCICHYPSLIWYL